METQKTLKEMKKLVKSVGFNEQRAKALQDKATELIVKSKTAIKESEIIHFMVDNMLEMIDIDEYGMFIIEDEEHKSEKIESVNRKITRGRK